jgi:uncharacterized protein YdhG (YjbR/CyaY superfamily)
MAGMKGPIAANIDDYIAGFEPETRKRLQQIRKTIAKAAPKAEEAIKYAMPTYVFHGNLVHFAGYKNHIGLYPAPNAISVFSKELAAYQTSKGAIQFPLDEPLPLPLITKIVKFRLTEALAAAQLKAEKKKK